MIWILPRGRRQCGRSHQYGVIRRAEPGKCRAELLVGGSAPVIALIAHAGETGTELTPPAPGTSKGEKQGPHDHLAEVAEGRPKNFAPTLVAKGQVCQFAFLCGLRLRSGRLCGSSLHARGGFAIRGLCRCAFSCHAIGAHQSGFDCARCLILRYRDSNIAEFETTGVVALNIERSGLAFVGIQRPASDSFNFLVVYG